MRVELGRKVLWKSQHDVSIARAHRPLGRHLRAGPDFSGDFAIPGLEVELVETTRDADVTVARRSLKCAFERPRIHVPVARRETRSAFDVFDGNVAVARADFRIGLPRDGQLDSHRAMAAAPVLLRDFYFNLDPVSALPVGNADLVQIGRAH